MLKRLHILFTGNVLDVDGEEDDLKKIVAHYVTGRLSGSLTPNSIIYTDTTAFCLNEVIAMSIGKADLTPGEKIVKIINEERGEGEAWKQSLRPDNEEDI